MRELTLNELDFISGGNSNEKVDKTLGRVGNAQLVYGASHAIGTLLYNNSETVRNVSGHIIETFDKVITEIRNEPRPDIGRQQGIDRMREMERINRETLKNAKQDSDAQPKDGSMYHC